ncbi:MAG: hypothetical protein ACTSXZ_08005 [Alphaproteobacteria bacterium]
MEPPILKTLEYRVDPRHTALAIIDMRKDFRVDGFATSKAGRPLGAAKSIIPRLENMLAAARARRRSKTCANPNHRTQGRFAMSAFGIIELASAEQAKGLTFPRLRLGATR